MKKNMKKVLALALAAVMVMALVGSAMAATIEITHDASYEGASGTTARVYNSYKIFDSTYSASLTGENTQADKDDFTYTPADAAISYSIATDSVWLPLFLDTSTTPASAVAAQTWVDLTLAADGSKYIVTPKSSFNSAAGARAFAEYLAANIPSGASATEITVDDGAVTVGEGYYLIVAKDSKDAVTRVAAITAGVNTLIEKNTYITTGKTTSETSYNVGDTVTYTATVTIPSDTALTQTDASGNYVAGHGPIIVHDSMDSRLTFQEDAAAVVDSAAFTAFTASYDADPNGWTITDGDTFELKIPVTSALLGKTITFTYTAIVNETAVSNTGFVNELFGELNGYKTNPDDVHVYTFDFPFKKVFNGSTDTALTATFQLRTAADDASTAIYFLPKASGAQEKAESASSTGASTTLTITNGETIDLVGLAAGDYYLVETGTSSGYNLLTGPIKVTITDTTTDPASPSHTLSYVDDQGVTHDSSITLIEIENNSGTVLPSTGGIGTTIFYVSGLIMVLGAAVILVARRRADAE